MSDLKPPVNSGFHRSHPNKWRAFRQSTPSKKHPGHYMSRPEYAEAIGCSVSAVRQWEQDGGKTPLHFFQKRIKELAGE